MAQTVPELPPQFNPMHDFSNLTVPGGPLERMGHSPELGMSLQEALDHLDAFLGRYNDHDRPTARAICEAILTTTAVGQRFMHNPSQDNRTFVEMVANLTTQAALSADMKITELGAGQAERALGSATE